MIAFPPLRNKKNMLYFFLRFRRVWIRERAVFYEFVFRFSGKLRRKVAKKEQYCFTRRASAHSSFFCDWSGMFLSG